MLAHSSEISTYFANMFCLSLLSEFLSGSKASPEKFSVHPGNVGDFDSFGAVHLALSVVGAIAEAERIHGGHHGQGPFGRLRKSLGKEGQVGYLATHKEHGGGIGAGSYAGTASYACGCVEGMFCLVFGYRKSVGIRRLASIHRDKPARLNDLVKDTAIDNQILDDRKGASPEWFYHYGISVLEVSHV